MKKFLFFVGFLLLGSAYAGILEIEHAFHLSDFNISQDRFTVIGVDDDSYIYKSDPGTPSLPYLMMKLVVPAGAEFEELSTEYQSGITLEQVTMIPNPEVIPTDRIPDNYLPDPNPDIYNNYQSYPLEIVEFTGVHILRNYRFFTFLVSPFIYHPRDRTLDLIESITIQIQYSHGFANEANRWDDGTYYEYLSHEVINPQDLPIQNLRSPVDQNDVKYLIITSEELSPYFKDLATWKTSTGIPAQVITKTQIYANYSEDTNQLKIKKCIEDYYLNKGTAWVLLGGDNSVIPVQGCYGSAGGYTNNVIPTDLFYACFDNQFDWNADGDGLRGEMEDDIDLAPEVIIARAPVRNADHVSAFINKTINYEINQPQQDFSEKMLLYGVKLFRIWEGRSDADWRNERLWNDYVSPFWNGNKYRYYDTNTDFGGASYDVTPDHTIEQFDSGYNYIFAATHGAYTSIGSEAVSGFNTSYISSLSNVLKEGMMATIACHSNGFDAAEPSFSEALLRADNGGVVAYHGSSRQGWGINYPTDYHGASYNFSDQLYQYLFSTEMVTNNHKFGAAATEAKLHFIDYCGGDGPYRWLMFSINAIGDPELDLYTQNPLSLDVTAPENLASTNGQSIIIETNIPDAQICFTNWEDLYLTGITDGNGNFETTITSTSNNDITFTINKHNLSTYTDTISIGITITPPTGTGPSGNPIAYDIPEDQGGWIGIDYILSENDPYHSNGNEPYLDYYLIEKRDGSGEWQYLTAMEPIEPTGSNNNGTLLIAVPASEESYEYRMAAVYNPGDNSIQSSWADAGTATSSDETPVYIQLKVFLEGPYQDNVMNHDLYDQNIIPTTSPFDGQTIELLPETGDEFIVDWLHIELRLSEYGESDEFCNAFLLSNGNVVNLEGENSLPFYYTTGIEYYLIVKHRNHVGIMSAQKFTLSDDLINPVIVDLTAPGSIYGIGYKTSLNGELLMIAGDASNNNQVQNSDKNDFWLTQVNLGGYLEADFNLNGQVQNSDKNDFWINNVNLGTTIPVNDDSRDLTVNSENLTKKSLKFSFANASISRDRFYYEFDIMIEAGSICLLGDSHVYLNYNPEAFGETIASTENVIVFRGEILEGELAPGIDLYGQVDLDDNDIDRLGIHLPYNFPQNPEYANLITTQPVRLYHVMIKIADASESTGLYFENSEFLPMSGQQYLADNSSIFKEVITCDELDDILSPKNITCEREETPMLYGLGNNYPNPFNPQTNITFVLPVSSYCEVSVYNLKGQKIRKLYAKETEKDQLMNLIWDGKDDHGLKLGGGVYFYQLVSSHLTQTKKMIMTK